MGGAEPQPLDRLFAGLNGTDQLEPLAQFGRAGLSLASGPLLALSPDEMLERPSRPHLVKGGWASGKHFLLRERQRLAGKRLVVGGQLGLVDALLELPGPEVFGPDDHPGLVDQLGALDRAIPE